MMTDSVALPNFPESLLNTQWQNNRTDRGKLKSSAIAIRSLCMCYNVNVLHAFARAITHTCDRYTLSTMCGMHVHTTKPKRGEDVVRVCEEKYKCLIRSFKNKYPRAAVNQFLEYTTLTQLQLINGKKVYTMSKTVRCKCCV